MSDLDRVIKFPIHPIYPKISVMTLFNAYHQDESATIQYKVKDTNVFEMTAKEILDHTIDFDKCNDEYLKRMTDMEDHT